MRAQRFNLARGIDPVQHLPGVGENLRDHANVRMTYECAKPLTVNDVLRNAVVKARAGLLDQDWGGLRPAFPVASGGLHAGIVPDVMRTFGPDQVIQLGGGVHGHPDGTRAGARALLDVIHGTMDGRRPAEIAKTSPAFARSVEKWGKAHPV